MNTEPTPGHESALSLFKIHGPLKLRTLINEGKVIIDLGLKVARILKDEGDNYDYHGQVNAEGVRNGFGRRIHKNGAVREGMWIDGRLTGFGRILWADLDYDIGMMEDSELKQGKRLKPNGTEEVR